MDANEKKLSDYIDSLNYEQKPKTHHDDESQELDELYQTVRLIRSLKEPEMPDKNFSTKLTQMVKKKKTTKHKKKWFLGISSVAAIFALFFTVSILTTNKDQNIVFAMENAFEEVKAYHGMMQIEETNANGSTVTQAKLEVWADKDGHYYVKKLGGFGNDIITVNNGEKKWQINPDRQEVIIFPAFPDDYRFTFEIGNEIHNIKNALSTKELGEETISGRKATILEVTPQGGKPYKIWIDQETNMPLQKQTAMQNATQYQVSYTNIEFRDSIPNKVLAYHVPTGYTEVNTHRVQIVNMEEAKEIIGFTPVVVKGYVVKQVAVDTKTNVVNTRYTLSGHTIILLQGKATKDFTPSSTAMIGRMGEKKIEIQYPVETSQGILDGGAYAGKTNMASIRWQQDGYEYAVIGDASVDELTKFVSTMTGSEINLPQKSESKPIVEVPVDMEIEKSEQQNADAGHSLYKLDPIFATQVFVSLKISPEGITGEYPIKEEDLTLVKNNDIEAIVEVSGDQTPVARVYLKRVIRQDSTGIWTVVGYDPK